MKTLKKLLNRGSFGMLFWAIGLATQGIYMWLMISRQVDKGPVHHPSICENPVGKAILYMVVSWVIAVAIGGLYQFAPDLDRGENKRKESLGMARPVYLNVFISIVYIIAYIVTFRTECTV